MLRKFLTALLIIVFMGCSKMESEYQKYADEKRLENINYVSSLVEKYNENTGHYPFLKVDKAYRDELKGKYVAGANNEYQALYIFKKPQLTNIPNHYEKLTNLLKIGLEEPFNLPYDPQNTPVYSPRGYIYHSNGIHYKILTYLGTPHKLAVERGKFSYEYTMTDRGVARVFSYSSEEELKAIMEKEKNYDWKGGSYKKIK
jgi:hypothetical protein